MYQTGNQWVGRPYNASSVTEQPKMQLIHHSLKETELVFSNGTIVFFSFSDPVVAYTPELGWMKIAETKSKTTNRHINDFLVRRADSRAKTVPQEEINRIVGAL